MTIVHVPSAEGTPLLLLSADASEVLAAAASGAGWRVVAARYGDELAAHFRTTRARVALIDTRGAFDAGLEALRALDRPMAARAGVLLALIDAGDRARIGELVEAGATLHLASPFDDRDLVETLGLATLFAARLARPAEPDDTPAGCVPAVPRDALTGLADAAAADAWISARLGAADATGCVLLRLAVSRFDMINAAFGRAAGDALLQDMARRVTRLAEAETRLVARLAGAEFLVGLPAPATVAEAAFLAERLVDAVARPFVAGDRLVTLSARAGIAAAEPGERSAAGLLRRAAAALAKAEAGTVRTLDRRGAAAAVRAGGLEIDLRRALDADEIGLLFQPQVEVTSGRIVGVEALARWRHPRLGELGADELFAAAARSSFLAELSDHVQRKAAGMAAGWGAPLGDCRVAINVTALDVARPGFAARFAAVVDAAGLDRARVTVEVTEGSLIEDLGQAAALLASLRGDGFRIALDDFGTGYSSLAYLKALPLDYLKIDKRLSEDIAGSPRDRIVVRGVIEMARSLGLAVIAEGVETEAQLALLAAEGCNYYQGYLCAPPLAADALERLIAREERRP